jgi:mono/diheme cytochrome c family protein
MKQLLLLSFFIAVIVACGNTGSGASNSDAAASAQPAEGAKLYKLHCVTCHGLYGDMGAAGAFNLQQSKLTLDQRVEVITKGRNTMTGFQNLLSPEKIKLIAEYTLQLKSE